LQEYQIYNPPNVNQLIMVSFTIMARFNIDYRRISVQDFDWLTQQESCVLQLWAECMKAEGYGQHFAEIKVNLSERPFRRAKAALEEQGLFEFEPIFELSQAGRAMVVGWQVRNLHGTKNTEYWKAK
jgi:hypothetical protein